ncbi:MAG: cation-translocating P-type ATPase, partial [Proteobacteria bacterium]|nr:cation-translocating P-type ATPase [Pseudomonadota bacterium]
MNVATRAEKVRFHVEGMDCASCAGKIETALRRVPGVTDVAVSVTGGTVIVSRNGGRVDDDKLRTRIADLGYRVEPAESGLHDEAQGVSPARRDEPHAHSHTTGDGTWWRTPKGLLTLASGVALAVAFGVGNIVPATERWAFLLAMSVGLVPIARRALSAARSGTPFSIEMLMSIAAIGAVIIGATEEAATVVFLFLIGELLEGVAAARARASIRDLTKLVPKTARLEDDEQVREISADSLEVGATIQIRPGDRIPADGIILSGHSAIDEAPVTGESTPVRKGPDALVFAGTVNG